MSVTGRSSVSLASRRTAPAPKGARSAKPSGVMLNRKNLRSVRDAVIQNYDAEYLYLRENELTYFDADVKLENLRVLDLSINDIGGSVDFLAFTPRLRHLYMTGNKIETLMGISNMASLETVCLSDNAISSFEGLEKVPGLRVLSLNFNNIASFKHYPILPNIHTLNLVGNPIAEHPAYRNMAIAINGPGLVSVDGNPVLDEERAAVEHYQGKVVFCIREGFTVENDETVEEDAHEFFLNYQREAEAGKHLQLCSIRLVGQPSEDEEEGNVLMEGEPVVLTACLQDTRPYAERTADVFHSPHLYPVIFKVSGEATEVFVVGSMNEWTDPIELERCEENGEVYFHSTLYLPAGDYEYRYVVDGVEKVSETNRIESKFNKGYCNLYQVTELDINDDEETTILHIRWMRSNAATGGYDIIDGENGLQYVPRVEDIGCCLRTEVLAYVAGEYSFQYFDITTPIVAAPPSCPNLTMKGDAVEGAVLMAEADYTGGIEGNSSLIWYRVLPSGEEIPINQRDPWAGYTLTAEDIDCTIRVEFTPVRNDWVAGEPRSVSAGPVIAGPPTCRSIKILGNLLEGSLLEVDVVYAGGHEGASYYQWLRKQPNKESYIPIEGETDVRYIPTLEDVGLCLAVEYTPVNTEGKEGETCRCVLESPIEAMAPEAHGLSIGGQLEEGHVLTLNFEYSGGEKGAHMIQWYRRDGQRKLTKAGVTNSSTLTLTEEEVGCFIEVSLTPVRVDGVKGKQAHARSDDAIAPAAPEVKFLAVVGEPTLGAELTLDVKYVGGREGASEIEWQIEDPDTQEFSTVATGVTHYTIKKHDQGKNLKVTYVPVRSDGDKGEAKSRILQISGEVQPPTPVRPPTPEPEPEPEQAAPEPEPEPEQDPEQVKQEEEEVSEQARDIPLDASPSAEPEERNGAAEEPKADEEPKTEEEPKADVEPKTEEEPKADEENKNEPAPAEEPKEEEKVEGNIKISLDRKKDSDADSTSEDEL